MIYIISQHHEHGHNGISVLHRGNDYNTIYEVHVELNIAQILYKISDSIKFCVHRCISFLLTNIFEIYMDPYKTISIRL